MDAGPRVAFGLDPMWVSSLPLVATYALIIIERVSRSIIALRGAGLVIVSGVLTQDGAIRGIDIDTIALLTGLMVLHIAICHVCLWLRYL